MTNLLQERIAADLKVAMKARDKHGKAVLRSLKSALDQQVLDSGKELDEAAALIVIKRQYKLRNEAAEVYASGNEDKRAAAELAEAATIEVYMPTQLGEEEIAKHVTAAIAATGASALSEQGKVMGHLAGVLGGRADMKAVAASVRTQLSP